MAGPPQQQQQQQQRWLKDMGLPQQDLQLLASQNIHTARDLLTQSLIDLVERLNIPLSHAQRLLQHVAMQVAPPYVTVSDCKQTRMAWVPPHVVPLRTQQNLPTASCFRHQLLLHILLKPPGNAVCKVCACEEFVLIPSSLS